jgi:hypothetical protein
VWRGLHGDGRVESNCWACSDRDAREQRRIEAEETLRRRNLTPEERQAEDEYVAVRESW